MSKVVIITGASSGIGKAAALKLIEEGYKVYGGARRIDVLFNNAGYGLYGAVEDIDVESARKQFEVNLVGLAEMTKAVLPQMRKQKSAYP